jgi:hypothetical protein
MSDEAREMVNTADDGPQEVFIEIDVSRLRFLSVSPSGHHEANKSFVRIIEANSEHFFGSLVAEVTICRNDFVSRRDSVSSWQVIAIRVCEEIQDSVKKLQDWGESRPETLREAKIYDL